MDANQCDYVDRLVKNVNHIPSDADEIKQVVDTLMGAFGQLNAVDVSLRNIQLFKLDSGSDVAEVHREFGHCFAHLSKLAETEQLTEVIANIQDLKLQVDIGFEAALALRHQMSLARQEPRHNLPDMRSGPFFERVANESTFKNHQQLLRLFTQRIRTLGYQKKNSALYKPVCTSEGRATFSFEYVCDIKDFVYKEASPDTIIWDLLTENRSNADTCIKHLTACTEEHIVHLKRDQSWFAFANGVLDANTETFHDYDTLQGRSPLPPGYSCAVYHAAVYDAGDAKHVSDIDTSAIETILDAQDMDAAVKFIFYALIGRMLFPAGKHDAWQFWVHLIGVGGSGKSTLLEVISKIYDGQDVGVLESKGQENFTFEHLFETFFILVHDVGESCNLSATQLFTMISNERCTVARKFKTAVSMYWNQQGMMAGNAYPPWLDPGGAASRRFVSFWFPNLVMGSDPNLHTKLKLQIPNMIKKGLKAYFQLLSRTRPDGIMQDIWAEGVLPLYFHERKKDFMRQSNPLQQFLEDSEYCTLDARAEVPLAHLLKHYKFFLQSHGIKAVKAGRVGRLGPEMYKPIFHANKLVLDARIVRGVQLVKFVP